jgi:hypothetical protein
MLYFYNIKGKVVSVFNYLSSGGIDPLFLTSVLDGNEWSASGPCRFTLPGKEPSIPVWFPEQV